MVVASASRLFPWRKRLTTLFNYRTSNRLSLIRRGVYCRCSPHTFSCLLAFIAAVPLCSPLNRVLARKQIRYSNNDVTSCRNLLLVLAKYGLMDKQMSDSTRRSAILYKHMEQIVSSIRILVIIQYPKKIQSWTIMYYFFIIIMDADAYLCTIQEFIFNQFFVLHIILNIAWEWYVRY